MDESWGNQKTEPPDKQPRRRTEYGYLSLGSASLTAAAVLCVVDHLAHLGLRSGVYSILVGLFVVGLVGWVVRSSDSQRRRDLAAGMHYLCRRLHAVEELTTAVQQVKHERAMGRATGGPSLYISQAAQAATVPLPRRSQVDSATVPGQLRVAEDRSEVDEARTQGYAEGYVDGLARRQEGTSAN